MSHPILVTGAAGGTQGSTGRLVAGLLLEQGIPVRALDGIHVELDLNRGPESVKELTTAEIRRTALTSRADLLEALAEYAASQAALQLEIAKQYPDIHLQPGYEFDQGDSKWGIGASVELPVLSRNQGPIAEAKAKREESAARFIALQAKVLAEIDRAIEQEWGKKANNLYTLIEALEKAKQVKRDGTGRQAVYKLA